MAASMLTSTLPSDVPIAAKCKLELNFVRTERVGRRLLTILSSEKAPCPSINTFGRGARKERARKQPINVSGLQGTSPLALPTCHPTNLVYIVIIVIMVREVCHAVLVA